MRGHNQVWVSGYVGGKIVSGSTKDGNPAFSFMVFSEDSGKNETRVRINAYGPVAKQCDEEAVSDVYCTVIGELMNRSGQYGKITEIRAKKINFFPTPEDEEEMKNEWQAER